MTDEIYFSKYVYTPNNYELYNDILFNNHNNGRLDNIKKDAIHLSKNTSNSNNPIISNNKLALKSSGKSIIDKKTNQLKANQNNKVRKLKEINPQKEKKINLKHINVSSKLLFDRNRKKDFSLNTQDDYGNGINLTYANECNINKNYNSADLKNKSDKDTYNSHFLSKNKLSSVSINYNKGNYIENKKL